MEPTLCESHTHVTNSRMSPMSPCPKGLGKDIKAEGREGMNDLGRRKRSWGGGEVEGEEEGQVLLGSNLSLLR